MELWIRSQYGERLCKVNNIFIKGFAICCSYNEEDDDYDYLGCYKTRERVLEVLDEIQHRLITLCDSMNRKLYVYEMPKE